MARVAVQYGQYARGFELSFAEPFFLGNRLGVGIDLYCKQTLATNYISYNSQTVGVGTRAGFALSEELSFQARYNIYSQKITLPYQYNNCQFSPNALINGGPGVNRQREAGASPPATRRVAAATPTAKPRLPSARSWQPARCWCRCSDTPSPTTPSTTTRTRPPAFTPSSSRTSPASAATSTSFARPPTRAATTRCFPTSSPCSISRAVISPAGAARTCACWIISRWARTWFAALRRPALDRAI